MAEWSNAPDSKSGIRLYRIEGSNPSLSATTKAFLATKRALLALLALLASLYAAQAKLTHCWPIPSDLRLKFALFDAT